MKITNYKAFTLLELLIVVTIIAILVGLVIPFYQEYVKESKIAKAKHELDIIKEAIIKFNTFEDRKFYSTDLQILVGRYLTDLRNDPWNRPYEVMPASGIVRSLGPDHLDSKDDIVVYYLPPLTLYKATWIDLDNNRRISASDVLKLEFTRYLMPDKNISYTNDINIASAPPSPGAPSLYFSPDVKVTKLQATFTPPLGVATISELIIPIIEDDNEIFFPGSSTVAIASCNSSIQDFSGNFANGTYGYSPALPVVIKASY